MATVGCKALYDPLLVPQNGEVIKARMIYLDLVHQTSRSL